MAQQHRKRDANKGQRHKRVNTAAKKKRLSYIKKMKELFEEKKGTVPPKIEEEDEWVNEPDKGSESEE